MDSDFGVSRELSDLQKHRVQYQPILPPCLQGTAVRVEFGGATTASDPAGAHTISRAFPHTYGQPLVHFLRANAVVPDAQIITEHPSIRVGVVFCGRQSPGGHNVIWGLYNAIKCHNAKSILIGFVGGTEGLFAQKTLEITEEVLSTYKNQDGLVRRFMRDENGVYFDRPSPSYDHKDFVPLEVKAGSLVLLHGDLIHQSFVNQSSKSRHAYSLHAVDTDGCVWAKEYWLDTTISGLSKQESNEESRLFKIMAKSFSKWWQNGEITTLTGSQFEWCVSCSFRVWGRKGKGGGSCGVCRCLLLSEGKTSRYLSEAQACPFF